MHGVAVVEREKEEPTRRRNRKRRVRPSFQPPDSKSERDDLKPYDFSHALAPVVKYHRMFGFGPVGGMGSASIRAGPAPLTPPLPPSLARTETQICCRARPTPGEAEGEGECQEEAAVWQEGRAVIGGARCMYAWGGVLISVVSLRYHCISSSRNSSRASCAWQRRSEAVRVSVVGMTVPSSSNDCQRARPRGPQLARLRPPRSRRRSAERGRR